MNNLIAPFRLRAAARLLPALLLLLAPARAQQAPQTLTLSKVEFEGLARVTPADALARSGLAAGQTATVEQIEAAAGRLADSGLFRKLGYSIKGATDAATLTFHVEEMKWGVRVVFDNFIWFTDEELAEAVRRRLPTFDGTAPEVGNVTGEIAQALQEFLRSRNVEGTVEYVPSADPTGGSAEHVFTVKGASMRVCSLSFPGARALAEEELVRKSGPVFDRDYSRLFVEQFLAERIVPLYHERGMMRATFAPMRVTKAPPTEECGRGLAVAVPVDEGSIYVYGGAEWSGQQAMTPQELDAALGVRARDIANAASVEKGLAAVRRAYGRRGYLAASAAGTFELDDANRRVLYRFTVREGPQYRMGSLAVEGLDERDSNNVKVRWRILAGEVYDEGYPAEFIKKNVQEFVKEALLREGRKVAFTAVEPHVRPDHEKHTVDVTLEFKK